MKQLAIELLAALRAMDAEATSVEGWPTGLWGYRAYRSGEWKQFRGTAWENAWTERLSELLPHHGRRCEIQKRYPDSLKTCDLLVSTDDSHNAWIEVKGAWPANVGRTEFVERADRRNGNFERHLHLAADDVVKLEGAQLRNASLLGLLLVGFPSQRFPILDDHLHIIRSRMEKWEEFSEAWIDEAWKGREIKCWFWARRL